METKIMKKTKTALFGGALKWILGACLVFMGVQSSFAAGCAGKVYFQPPKDWSTVYLATQNHEAAKMSLDSTRAGYYVADLGSWPQETYNVTGFSIGNSITTPVSFIDSVNWVQVESGDASKLKNNQFFTCPGEGKEMFIYENPAKLGTTVISTEPPNAKYLYLMVPPEKEDWMSSTPMVSMDGGKTGKPMKAVSSMCGWYYYVWFGEAITDSVVFFRDDDLTHEDQIGMNGNWETNDKATLIPLNVLFAATNTLYFVPDEELKEDDLDGWFDTDPGVDGVCEYTLAAIIYDTDASLHGAFTCNPDWTSGQTPEQAHQNACSSPSAPFQVAKANGEIPCIGVTQGMVTDILDNVKGSPTYKKPQLTTKGQGCFGSQSTAAFSAMFNSTTGVNETYCVDVPFTKSSDNKWEFDSDNYKSNGATVSGGFYPAEQSPAPDRMMSVALPAAEYKRKAEGPVFMCAGLRALDPVEGVPYSDLLCNGPGWSGGKTCEGLFAGGSEFDGTFNGVKFSGDGWGWGCPNEAPIGWNFYKEGTETFVGTLQVENQIPSAGGAQGAARWTSGSSDAIALSKGGRNQHFCFESHAQFTYKKGLRFSFRGDDDIWVYIDNKLAVDLGGTHLAAPGYVDLDKFVGTTEGGFVDGDQYDLDIFFCDRRTTMSNVRIKTNMYIIQKTDITYDKKKAELCYNKSGDGSCAAAIAGTGDESLHCCGNEINSVCGAQVSYVLVKGRKIEEGAETHDATTVPGIDISNPYQPVVDKKKVKLPPGLWTLFVVIDGKTRKIETFRTTGNVDVVYGDAQAVYFDADDNEIGRTPYTFINSVMGTSIPADATTPKEEDMIPVYVSALAGTEQGKVIMQPSDAVGVEYSLTIPDGMVVYRKVNGVLVAISDTDVLTVGDEGVDTLYASVPLILLSAPTQSFSLGVKGGSQTADLTFYLPRLSFVNEAGQSITQMADTEAELWTGNYYTFEMVALKPNNDGTGSYSPCETCNFAFSLSGELSSKKIEIKAYDENGLNFVNGKAKVLVRSLNPYRRGIEAANIVIIGENPEMKAVYSAFFREPPVPTPVMADVFDVHGKEGSAEIAKIYSGFRAPEYQDGIADSLVIYYHRRIHKDSLPLAVCVLWDTASAEAMNPFVKGYSNQTEENVNVLCNAVVEQSSFSCITPDDTNYCEPRLDLGGLALSKSVKTSGSGYVTSYAKFIDKRDTIMQGFGGEAPIIVDRIAPIPLSATIVPQTGNEKYSNLTITMSEPVEIKDRDNQSALSFYLKSSSLDSSARMMPIASRAAPSTSVENGKGKISVLYCTDTKQCGSANVPQEGDYVRLGGDLANVMWSDVTEIAAGYENMRPADDATYYWNSPTGYQEQKRLPTPWVIIGGRTPAYIYDVNFAHTGNAAACETCTDVITPFVVSSLDEKQKIIADMKGLPGHFVTSNMMSIYSQIIEGDAETGPGKVEDMNDFYFYYKVEYFTNLGAYVAGKSGKIYCKDDLNMTANGAYFFGGAGHDCTEGGTYFFLAWNMNSDKGRTVGSGAYISKMETYVRVNGEKKNKKDETSVFGIKRSAIPYARTWEDFKKNNGFAD